jgi:predicted  nucleic acid-binding Zn-ribbon protein
MALIKCERCGKMFSDRAKQCPDCGCTKEEGKLIALEKQKQAEREAEEARIKAEKEAEEARIKAEQEAAEQAARRKEWWQKNKTKVIIGIIIFIGAIVAAICVYTHNENIKQETANLEARQEMANGDRFMIEKNFDQAEECYNRAYRYTNEQVIKDLCHYKMLSLSEARIELQIANQRAHQNQIIPTNAELWEEFEADYLRYYNITSLNQSTYSVNKKNIQNFLYAGKKEGADISRILTSYSSDWKWLGDYIQEVNGTQITSEIRWRFSVVAFFLANEGDARYSVDFSWAGKPEAWERAYQRAH